MNGKQLKTKRPTREFQTPGLPGVGYLSPWGRASANTKTQEAVYRVRYLSDDEDAKTAKLEIISTHR